jgi:hypothetical protein
MRSSMEKFSGAQTAEYQMQYMTTELKDVLASLNNDYIGHLTDDIIAAEATVDFKEWLGDAYYRPSNSNAKDCLEICLRVKHLYGYRIKGWTDNALKCFDNFLLKYIQEDQKEIISKRTGKAKESDVYHHLIGKGGKIQEIGESFAYIYQTRNEFHHVQVVDSNGVRVPSSFSNSKYNIKRDLIVGWFRVALTGLITEIK